MPKFRFFLCLSQICVCKCLSMVFWKNYFILIFCCFSSYFNSYCFTINCRYLNICKIEWYFVFFCFFKLVNEVTSKFDYFLFWLKIQDFHHHRTYFKYEKTILKINPILNLKLIWQQTWLTFERSFTKCMFCFYKNSFWCCFKTFKLMSSLGCCKVFKAIQHCVIKFFRH
jgi:hypothetical protein